MINVGVKGRLYKVSDLMRRLGVGRQRIYTLTRRRDFPEPYDEWADGTMVWEIDPVEKWISASSYADYVPEDEP